MTGVDDKPHFVSWLRAQKSVHARYAYIRHSNGLLTTGNPSNMSGHFHSAFFGIREFLRTHPKYQGTLRSVSWKTTFWNRRRQLEHDFAQFVHTNWANFPGQKGGDWRKKLPSRHGGLPSSGGRGSGLVSRMLILLDRYGHQQGY